MAAGVNIDYWGLADADLELISSSDGKTKSESSATNRRGDVIATNATDEHIVPTCVYAVKGDYDLSALSLGECVVWDTTKAIMIGSVSVLTDNSGELPRLTVSGEQVEDGATTATGIDGAVALPAITVSAKFGAQNLAFSSDPIAGANGDLTSSTWTASCTILRSVPTGTVLASGIAAPKFEQVIAYNIVTAGNTTPTITPPTNYRITSPATMDESGVEAVGTGSCTVTDDYVRTAA